MADTELTNWKCGIDVVWGVGDGSDKGTAYAEEYFYHDKLSCDAKVVYLHDDTAIRMSHNARNLQDEVVVGINGPDNIADSGDEGVIRYKIDRDRQVLWKWVQNALGTEVVAPAYSGPFTLASQTYDGTVPVVGTTGGNGGAITSKTAYYYRGITDPFGDEWHVLSYADDDNHLTSVDVKFRVSDAKSVLLVVNPKTPCLTARVTGTGQFFTTRPKASFTPKVVAQTTYIAPGTSGTVTIELRDINGNNVFYRINGGSYTDAGASTVTLTDSQFSTGSNTLEYYYAGNAAYTKTRIVVKNPAHPSLVEAHGNYLWGDTAGYNAIVSRLGRTPYSTYYNAWRTSGSGNNSGQTDWPAWYHTGKRDYPGQDALINAFVAKVEGFNYTRSGESKSYGLYAKEMILENSRVNDPVGFELSHSGDASGNRELHAFGYYEAVPVLRTAFAYDIFVANFRDDQVTGGITSIENYFVRDTLACFAYEAMQWSQDGTAFEPGMWGGARMMCSAFIAMIMPEYSTPYYGTSGFGTVQTTYPLCPYQDDEYTWKKALFDDDATRTAWPNYTWRTYYNIASEGEVFNGSTYSAGDALCREGYMGTGQMGQWWSTWPNMALMHANRRHEKFEAFISRVTSPTGITTTNSTGARLSLPMCQNSRWPVAITNARDWMLTLGTGGQSFTDYADNIHVLAIAWYDDEATGDPDTTAPTLSSATIPTGGTTISLVFDEAVTRTTATPTVSLSGGAATLTYASGSGTSTHVYNLSRTIESGETGTLSVTLSAGNWVDGSNNSMTTVSGFSITNNSTQSGEPPPTTTTFSNLSVIVLRFA